MSPTELIAIIALVAYAVYKQTQVAEVRDKGRFKLAIIYGIVGVCVGGFTAPHTAGALGLLAASILLSLVVGLSRGRLTRMWLEPDGRVLRQGTVLTVSLFLGLIVIKFGLGTVAYLAHIPDSGGFGEIMVMMAIMVAVQAQLIKRRAAAIAPVAARTAAAPSLRTVL